MICTRLTNLCQIGIPISIITLTLLLGSLALSLFQFPSHKTPHILRRTNIEIHYQSAHIPFNEWLSQLTLCLAPFAAHILTGVPPQIILRNPPPPFYLRLSLFNPITIIYRYILITIRRVRAKTWTATDMAASNAAFWDGEKWDGSEILMVKSKEWSMKVGRRNRVGILSVSMIGTGIVGVQGVQAVWSLGQQLVTKVAVIQAIAGLFIPLGGELSLPYPLLSCLMLCVTRVLIMMDKFVVGSLFRLPPAHWLSDEFGYDMLSEAPLGFELITPSSSSTMLSQNQRDRSMDVADDKHNLILTISTHEITDTKPQRSTHKLTSQPS